MDALTGGAEIFQSEVRKRIATGEESAAEYLDVHRRWHRLWAKSTCAHALWALETLEDRIDHLRQLRELRMRQVGSVDLFHCLTNLKTTASPSSTHQPVMTCYARSPFLGYFWIILTISQPTGWE